MLDTVQVMAHVSPTSKQLENWLNNPLIIPGEEPRNKFFQNAAMDSGAGINLIYYPSNPRYPEPALLIQVSLPKVLYGNNVEMITSQGDIDDAIREVNDFIGGTPWIPNVDIGKEALYRIDLAYNHQVGDRVQDYIRALSNLDYPLRKTEPYLHEGVQFFSSAASTKFYDKHQESLLQSALGILRQETTLRRNSYIARRMGGQRPTLRDVTPLWVSETLQEDLRRLGLLNGMITNRDLALEILTSHYGMNTAMHLLGYLMASQSMTTEQMIDNGTSERSIQRWNKMLADAGVSLAMTDAKVALPPLTIDMESAKNGGRVLSDTLTGPWSNRGMASIQELSSVTSGVDA